MKYRKKPVVVEAEQLTWSNLDVMREYARVGRLSEGKPEGCYLTPEGRPYRKFQRISDWIGLKIPTRTRVLLAVEGDWIIRKVDGTLSVCRPDEFARTYEAVEEQKEVTP